ncbi:MAG: acetate/propionate family kinase [Acidimicrobiia bacterium]
MSRTVLVLNSGSSSLKYQLVDPDDGRRLASGLADRIGEDGGSIEHHVGAGITHREGTLRSHREALRAVVELFDERGPALSDAGIVAVGHRVVMGGREFAGPARIDDHVLATIERLSPLAPLHNPANLAGIEVARQLLPDVVHVAVFDTAFFHDLPDVAATYALDREVADRHGIRRYGFHGTSHQYVSRAAAAFLGRDLADLRQIVLHLGNGASASAIDGGRAVDTSMGLTPLEGLVMGTRTGDIDPAVVLHLARTTDMELDDIDALLNRRSGMRGLTGHNDLREVHRLIAAGDADARLGLDVYVHRLRKYIGAYTAVLGGLDVLTFTAGVGENDAVVRREVAAGLATFGIEVDPGRNDERSDRARRISPDGAGVEVLVVPTDEEITIAREAVSLL